MSQLVNQMAKFRAASEDIWMTSFLRSEKQNFDSYLKLKEVGVMDAEDVRLWIAIAILQTKEKPEIAKKFLESIPLITIPFQETSSLNWPHTRPVLINREQNLRSLYVFDPNEVCC